MPVVRRVRVVGGRVAWLAALAVALSALACVVEREPLRRPLRSAPAQPPPAAPPPLVVAPIAPAAVDARAEPPADAAPAAPRVRGDAGTPVDAEALPPLPPTVRAMPVPSPPGEALRACQADSDCVAVMRNGCCRSGLNEAVNKGSVEAYRGSFTCPIPRPICPMHLVLDRRQPACDAASHLCTLQAPP
jgi:hypothetical protein